VTTAVTERGTSRQTRVGSLDGVLVVAKPAGPTSHDVVALVRRLSGIRRVGHGGTLDPFASGVLPLFLGRATRVVEYHLADRKAYRATICFGANSTTDDLEGELTPIDGATTTREVVQAAFGPFLGRISQVPPAYSAVKVAGRRAYARARAGEPLELAPREVTIHSLDLQSWDERDPDRPIAIVDVICSAGTYIRALARDLGAAVGSGAYLGALVRTASGPFTLETAIPLDDLREASNGPGLAELLQPIDTGLDDLPELALSEPEVAALVRGQFVRTSGPLPDGPIRVRNEAGTLVAIGRARDGRLAPDKVLVDAAAPAA
jgi:tRNA pseudouridine55 synthase